MTLIKHCAGFFFLLAALTAMPVAGAEEGELLIRGARVIDPETGLDAVRDVALADGRIARIGPAGSLAGAEVLDAAGLVLAPGFIDLHAHGASARARDYQARDGVTTALELEWGYPVIDTYLASRQGKSRVNFGASASHGMLRSLAMVPDAERDGRRSDLAGAVTAEEPLHALQSFASEGFQKGTSTQQRQKVADELRRALGEGAIGIGMAHAYYPGADREEILELFQTAEALDTMIFTHARGRGLEAIQEVVANAAATGAALHIVHVNSTSLGEIEAALELIDGARARGVDVSTEAYPYTAGSTSIQSALFDGDWQAAYGISYDALQWQATGERLSAETFDRYRAQGGVIIIHMMREAWIDEAIGRDWVIVASDGMPYAPGAHPRTAGTFARVLGHYSRERGLVDLPTALARMTLLPAQRLEKIAPGMRTKGRVQTGMDADLVLFDPQGVIDTATFESGPSFSEGIEHVFVAGVAVVKNGELVPGAYPGRAILGAGARN